MKGIEFFIAKRYLFSKRRINFITIITLISIVGVTIGVAAMIIVLSVFNGFNKKVTDILIGFDPHIRIEAKSGHISEYENIFSDLQKENISDVSPYILSKGLLANKSFNKVCFIKGTDENKISNVSGVKDFTKFNTDKIVPSLRMGLNLEKCYTVQKEQPLPELMSRAGSDEDKIFWKWNQGVYDWSYPLSVDGHFFSTQEIAAMTKLIHFSAPNTYEDQL